MILRNVMLTTVFTLGFAAMHTLFAAAPPNVDDGRLEPPAGDNVRIDENALLLAATEHWRLWQTSEVVAGTEHHRAQTHTWRYYREKPNGLERSLIYTGQSTSSFARNGGIALPSGTTLLVASERLVYIGVDGNVEQSRLTIDGKSAGHPHGWTLWEDGAVVQLMSKPTYYFVPFTNDRLDGNAAQLLIAANANDDQPQDRIFFRAGREIAWLEAPNTLHVWNIATGQKRTVKLAHEFHPSWNVTAFDGATAMVGRRAFDATTGAARPFEPEPVREILDLRDGWVYYFDFYIGDRRLFEPDEISLVACSIDKTRKEAQEIHRVIASPTHLRMRPWGKVQRTFRGIIYWDGQSWQERSLSPP